MSLVLEPKDSEVVIVKRMMSTTWGLGKGIEGGGGGTGKSFEDHGTDIGRETKGTGERDYGGFYKYDTLLFKTDIWT